MLYSSAMLILALVPHAASLVISTRGRIEGVKMSVSNGEQQLLKRFGLPRSINEVNTDRRTALGLMAGAAVFSSNSPAQAQDGMFSLPPLPYAYDALEPHIDAATMKVMRLLQLHAQSTSPALLCMQFLHGRLISSPVRVFK